MSASMRDRPSSSKSPGDMDDAAAIQTLEQNLGKMEDNLKEFIDTFKAIKDGVPKLKESVENQQVSSRATEEHEMRLSEEIKAVKKENEDLRTEKNILEREMGKRGDEMKETRSKLQKTELELKNTQMRLSEVLGNKLINNNPDIADLSDQNRPSKLAEKFSELYDNEWTDAFEAFEKIGNYDERKCVSMLLKALQNVHSFCSERWSSYTNGLMQSILRQRKIEIPDYINKQLKDIAKWFAPQMVDDVFKEYLDESMTQTGSERNRLLLQTSSIKKYLEICVKICWLMAAQDPPVVMKTNYEYMGEFDNSVFRAYTTSGQKFDFLVWPPLFLYEDGPLLCKGVAQALKEKARPASAPANYRSNGNLSADSPLKKGEKAAWDPSEHNNQGSLQPVMENSRQGQNFGTGTFLHSSSAGTDNQQTNVQTKPSDSDVNSADKYLKQHQQTNMDESNSNPWPHTRTTQSTNQGYQHTLTTQVQWQQPQQQLIWKYSRIPTEKEINDFHFYASRYREEVARRILGNDLFDFCRDFNNFKEQMLINQT